MLLDMKLFLSAAKIQGIGYSPIQVMKDIVNGVRVAVTKIDLIFYVRYITFSPLTLQILCYCILERMI